MSRAADASDYEEDFDDYDDDFEAPEDAEERENSFSNRDVVPPLPLGGLQSTPSRLQLSPNNPRAALQAAGSAGWKPTQLSARGFAGMSDRQRKKVLTKLRQAVNKLPFITLEVGGNDLMYTASSLSEFDLYAMGRGTYANCTSLGCQTADDAQDEELQTDEISVRLVACQAPEDLGRTRTELEAASQSDQPLSAMFRQDAGQETRLNAFIRTVAPLVLAGVTGSAVKSVQLKFASQTSSYATALSSGHSRLAHDLVAGRPVKSMAFSPGSDPLLLVAYGAANTGVDTEHQLRDHSPNMMGCLCVWDLSNAAKPAHTLLSEGVPQCCCFAPSPYTHIIFAGMADGGVCAWDLHEQDAMHPPVTFGEKSVINAHRPSYSTECHSELEGAAAIVDLAASSTSSVGSKATVCQLVALTTWGHVEVFAVTQLGASQSAAAADTDLGLRLGSRIRLIKTSNVERLGMSTLAALKQGGRFAESANGIHLVQTHAIATLPPDGRLFVVGADQGRVLRGACVGVPPAPKEYALGDARSVLDRRASKLHPTHVTALHISPFSPAAFLAGHSDGTVAMHLVHSALPLKTWPQLCKSRVTAVRWSPIRPALFFAMDKVGQLVVVDIISEQTIYSENISKLANQSCSTFDLSPAGAVPSFALAFADGHVDCHSLSGSMTTAGDDELNTLLIMTGQASA